MGVDFYFYIDFSRWLVIGRARVGYYAGCT